MGRENFLYFLYNLGLEDIMTIGKHKGKSIVDTYKEDSGWLVWLRNERWAKNSDPNMFNTEVNTLLDMTIEDSVSLRRKYKTWSELNLYTAVPNTELVTSKPTVDPVIEYNAWGAF